MLGFLKDGFSLWNALTVPMMSIAIPISPRLRENAQCFRLFYYSFYICPEPSPQQKRQRCRFGGGIAQKGGGVCFREQREWKCSSHQWSKYSKFFALVPVDSAEIVPTDGSGFEADIEARQPAAFLRGNTRPEAGQPLFEKGACAGGFTDTVSPPLC
uniref:Uncharacterized protein n=1 Tax=Panagrellus redivivus TaxID=6233 RepID=A0A7E4UPA7_PANRE